MGSRLKIKLQEMKCWNYLFVAVLLIAELEKVLCQGKNPPVIQVCILLIMPW
jgi:hypothetical protein